MGRAKVERYAGEPLNRTYDELKPYVETTIGDEAGKAAVLELRDQQLDREIQEDDKYVENVADDAGRKVVLEYGELD